jgi:hypothetical protein
VTVDESSREKVKTNNKQQQKEQDEEEDITTTDCLIDRLLLAKRLEKSAKDKRLIARLPSKTNSPHTRESLAHHHHSRHTPYTITSTPTHHDIVRRGPPNLPTLRPLDTTIASLTTIALLVGTSDGLSDAPQ